MFESCLSHLLALSPEHILSWLQASVASNIKFMVWTRWPLSALSAFLYLNTQAQTRSGQFSSVKVLQVFENSHHFISFSLFSFSRLNILRFLKSICHMIFFLDPSKYRSPSFGNKIFNDCGGRKK